MELRFPASFFFEAVELERAVTADCDLGKLEYIYPWTMSRAQEAIDDDS
jgi:hypothetical protein